jgi:predicted MFS family arabinose efflux permease
MRVSRGISVAGAGQAMTARALATAVLAPQQSQLASLSPAQAPLLPNLNGSMLYIGTALGTIISGSLLDTVSFAQLSWVGVPFGLLALLTLAFDRVPVAVPSGRAAVR